MKKAILRVSILCSVLLFTFLLSACGGGATPPINNVWPTPTAGEEVEDSEATQIITSAYTAHSANPEDSSPIDPDTSFQAGEMLYVTFTLNLSEIPRQSDGTYGNVKAEFYNDGELYEDLLTFPAGITSAKLNGGSFGVGDYPATSQGQVKVYWCNTGDCNDPQLAYTLDFIVE